MDAVTDFVENSIKNFYLDLEVNPPMIGATVERVLTRSGCGWEEGYDKHYEVDARELLDKVEDCVQNHMERVTVTVVGRFIEYDFELDGSVEHVNLSTRTEECVKLEFQIDIKRNKITLLSVP